MKCEPAPNAFNPCEDIMGYDWLRCSVWFVILIGLFGNACVFAVILSKPSEMTVPNFLISNLAFSDLCMAVFLLLLGIEDLISEGYYFNYAYDWQRGLCVPPNLIMQGSAVDSIQPYVISHIKNNGSDSTAPPLQQYYGIGVLKFIVAYYGY